MEISSNICYFLLSILSLVSTFIPILIFYYKINPAFGCNSKDLGKNNVPLFTLMLIITTMLWSGITLAVISLGFNFNDAHVESDCLYVNSPILNNKINISNIECVKIYSDKPNSPYLVILLKNGKVFESVGTSNEEILKTIQTSITEKIKLNPTSQP